MTIASRYDHELRCQSDIVEHLPYFVELCTELQAKRVIELGVRGGVSTIAWLHGLDLSDGHLWSVDIVPAPDDIESERWTFERGDDTDYEIVSRLPTEVDIVFIDTSHTYDHTLKELETYLPLVRAGGRIVMHDTELKRPEASDATDPSFPVKTAIQEFCDTHHLHWSNKTNCNGLATIKVV